MNELRTFTEWLKFAEKGFFSKGFDIDNAIEGFHKELRQYVNESNLCCLIYRKYGGAIEMATPEEKAILKKYGYQVESPKFGIRFN